ncbi:DUF3305 domain-containing protein [Alisedimentitalea sp. MJ-SS2]|uniref:DUF3305 domain-containing protein n=1 Tax=Aliisedimentitalea sp. MJ-SS2 TaxID=3049795 RepID=UPI00290CF5A4|nr:DUF3305 domain-containing protein [Alisedimentitalea sp. MJ-SS2]MDU8929356.1 DUF3305 domain-containing protein [Alisedimentitalea sp. MJ-SS2]
MIRNPKKFETMPMGIVLRRAPGATRWAKWVWNAVGVLPGAAAADWVVLRQDGDVTEYHAATLMLELHGAETEAYLHGMSAQVPCLYVILRENDDEDHPLDVDLVTASPYEAQDYADTGDDIVEKVAMPPAVIAWLHDFTQTHHKAEEFKKRRRDRKDITLIEDGVGDARITQMADVYRSPVQAKKERLQ